MKPKTEAKYKEWVKEVEASLSTPEAKNAFKSLAENSDEGFKVFGGYLRESEWDRLQNELKEAERTVKADQAAIQNAMGKFMTDLKDVQDWYNVEAAKNEQLANAYNTLAARHEEAQKKLRELGLEDNTVTHPGGSVPRGVDDMTAKEIAALKQSLAQQSVAIPRILADALTVLKEGVKEGYEFDPAAVISHAHQNGVDLKSAFKALTADQREKKDAEKFSKELEKAREEGRREALSKFPSPERMKPSGPTIFDHLSSAPDAATNRNARINDAVKEFIETGGGTGGL